MSRLNFRVVEYVLIGYRLNVHVDESGVVKDVKHG